MIASSDGGATWTRQHVAASAGPFRVAFADARHGWLLDGWHNVVYATSDGWAHWRVTYGGKDDGAVLRDVAAISASRCCIVGYGEHETGFVARTSDGGRHWSIQAAVSPDKLLGVSFPDQEHGWGVGYGGTVIATTDGGATWKAQDAGGDYGLAQVSFSDAWHGWARISHLALLATEDGGQSWSVVRPMDTRDLLTGLATVDAPSVAGQ